MLFAVTEMQNYSTCCKAGFPYENLLKNSSFAILGSHQI